MEIYSTEEQQVEAIKKFWQENGTQIIVGAALGLAGFWGWNFYVDKKIEAQEAASTQFEKFTEVAGATDVTSESLESELKTFVDKHGDSGYAIFVKLIAAKQAVADSKFEAALEHLNGAAAQITDTSLKGLVESRIARVQIELKQYDAALSTLNAIANEGFKARVAELKGDVYLAKGDAVKARSEYQAAADQGGLQGNNLLQMKLDDLTLSASNDS